jgi:hypothetical protein
MVIGVYQKSELPFLNNKYKKMRQQRDGLGKEKVQL